MKIHKFGNDYAFQMAMNKKKQDTIKFTTHVDDTVSRGGEGDMAEADGRGAEETQGVYEETSPEEEGSEEKERATQKKRSKKRHK